MEQVAVNRLAALAAELFQRAGSAIVFRHSALDVFAMGATPQMGLLAAAIALRAELASSPQGREALRDLGFEPLPQNVEAE